MVTPEFDSFAQEYEALHAENTRITGYSTSYFAEYKIKEVARYLAETGRQDKDPAVLNFGCGIGNSEDYIRQYFPRSGIYSVDVSAKSIEYAKDRHRHLENMHFRVMDGSAIPFDIRFDVILIANVLHHVARAQHPGVLQTLKRALSPSGRLFLFEHNPLNPVTVRAVKACPFDKGVVLLSPRYTLRLLQEAGFDRNDLRFTLFFPKPLAVLTPLEKYLKRVPLGAQYYVVASGSARSVQG